MRDIKFDVMFKDEKVASITVKDNTVHALTYTDIRYKQNCFFGVYRKIFRR